MLDFHKITIERFDKLFDSINNKTNVFLGITIFVIGGLFSALTQLTMYLNNTHWAKVYIIIMIFLSIVILVILISSLIPYITKNKESLIYFGSISKMDCKKYIEDITKCTESDFSKDLAQQSHELAIGLSKKYRRLKTAGMLFLIEALILIPLIITIIKNIK